MTFPHSYKERYKHFDMKEAPIRSRGASKTGRRWRRKKESDGERKWGSMKNRHPFVGECTLRPRT